MSDYQHDPGGWAEQGKSDQELATMGTRARMLVEDEGFNAACSELRAWLLESFDSSDVTDRDMHLMIKMQLTAIRLVRSKLVEFVESGVIAEQKMAEAEREARIHGG